MSSAIMSVPNFSIAVRNTKQGRIFEINWTVRPVMRWIADKIIFWVQKSTNYAAMTEQKIGRLQEIVDNICRSLPGAGFDIDQAIAIAHIAVKEKIIKNYSRMNTMIAKIALEYAAGADILDISDKYDFPPLNLLRGILIHRGFVTSEVYRVFANKDKPETLLSGRDLEQYIRAEANDAESTFNQQATAKIAADNEFAVVDFFQSLGIRLATQDQLVKEQTEKYGHAILTPDILFLDTVFINGSRVNWIDYKDYIGTKVRFLFTSNRDQAAKYVNQWGSGAMCYHRSFVANVRFPKTILLDAGTLPITLKK